MLGGDVVAVGVGVGVGLAVGLDVGEGVGRGFRPGCGDLDALSTLAVVPAATSCGSAVLPPAGRSLPATAVPAPAARRANAPTPTSQIRARRPLCAVRLIVPRS
ncbi:hypothetical protein FXF50_26980 [Micromonospora sp. AP08]|nr:hypothetical protein FXF50_26980 [Micromonospora sp. AP08]